VKNLILLLSLLFATTAQAETRWLKDKPLYEEPLAYPRATGSYFFVSTSRYLNQRIAYLDAAIGKDMPIFTWETDEFALQTGVQASTWITLGYTGELSFPLLTQDFHFSIPLSARYKNLNGSIRFNHISAHKGDGIDDLVEEELSGSDKENFEQIEDIGERNGVNVSLVEPLPYSRDFFSGHLSYKFSVENLEYRHYVHAAYAHKMIPEELNRWLFGGGLEVAKKDCGSFTPFVAQDVTWNGDVDTVDWNFMLGTFFGKDDNNIFDIGAAASAYIGSDRRGQLLGRKMKQFSLGFFVR
jgi:hypothetical protein